MKYEQVARDAVLCSLFNELLREDLQFNKSIDFNCVSAPLILNCEVVKV